MILVKEEYRQLSTHFLQKVAASHSSSAGKERACDVETPVRFLGREDPLEKGQATHSSIFGLLWWLRW